MNTKSCFNHRRGATTVEIAICLPILLMLLFGSYEMARANMLLHAAESAAYEGARVGIVPGANREKIEDAVAFVLRSVGATNFNVDISPTNIDSTTSRITVEVSVPLKENTIMMQQFLRSPEFSGRCELTREVL